MALPWFRLYTEFASDPKIQILAFEDQRHYVMLLCLKGAGTLDSKAPPAYRERLIAKALGLDPSSGAEAKRRLIEAGLIDKNWQPVKWDERQFKSDYSTLRVREFRQKRACNVSETFQKRSETVRDTESDTDTDADTLRSSSSHLSNSSSSLGESNPKTDLHNREESKRARALESRVRVLAAAKRVS